MSARSLSRLFFQSGVLLGDYVASRAGRDVSITYWKKPGRRILHWERTSFLYKRSSNATLDGQFLGTASVYWAGDDHTWQSLATDRMKTVLARLGYQVQPICYLQGRVLRRLLFATDRRGKLCIDEILLLNAIACVPLCDTHGDRIRQQAHSHARSRAISSRPEAESGTYLRCV